MVFKSSCVYPNTTCLLSNVSSLCFIGPFFAGISAKCTKFLSNHFLYGCLVTISALISSSLIIRPWFISTKNIFPGSKRPCFSMFLGSKSITPVSEDIITYPSLVTEYLEGRKPFLSKTAPI